jgi:Methyltransferase domain
MALSTIAKNALNRVLAPINLRIETLTLARTQQRRLTQLARAGHFDRPVFPLPKSFEAANVSSIIDALPQFRQRFDTFVDARANDVGYSFDNDFFRSPDAEVFYTIIRTHKPARIIEVGSGHSTKIARQAIIDGKLETRLISIDPQPRAEIDSLANECIRQPVEDVDPGLFDQLQAGDILFIDSSHELRIGNDVAFLYTIVLPRLAKDVLVHIHDIFLPYDYPADFLADARDWNEQHLVHSMLMFGNAFEAIWPGYFLQNTGTDFMSIFPNNSGGRAQSLWLRKTTAPKVKM